MTCTEILASEQWPEQVCKKFSPHWQDLQQELFLLLATDLNAKAEKALAAGYFEFFYIRCARNLSGSGGRIGRINQGGEALEEYEDEEQDIELRQWFEEDTEQRLQAIQRVQARQSWYERKLCELYLSGMSGRKIHRFTKISKNEVSRVIREFRAQCVAEYL
jgi:hypothetical protein